MIIFGTGSKFSAEKKLETTPCPSCGEMSLIQQVYYRYFHLFWVPTFAYRKKREVFCNACGETHKLKKLSSSAKAEVMSLQTRVPVSLFSGIVLVIAAVFFLENAAQGNRAKYQAYVEAPKIHDNYVYEFAEGSEDRKAGLRYGVVQVKSITGENVVLTEANYGYEYWSDATKVLRRGTDQQPDFYSNQTTEMTLQDIKDLYAGGVIKAVVRIDKGQQTSVAKPVGGESGIVAG